MRGGQQRKGKAFIASERAGEIRNETAHVKVRKNYHCVGGAATIFKEWRVHLSTMNSLVARLTSSSKNTSVESIKAAVHSWHLDWIVSKTFRSKDRLKPSSNMRQASFLSSVELGRTEVLRSFKCVVKSQDFSFNSYENNKLTSKTKD